MVAAVTAVRITDRSLVDQGASASSTLGSNSSSSTSSSGATSSFDLLLLQQIGISLPVQSAYHTREEIESNPTSKAPSADESRGQEQKSKEKENTTAVNYFFSQVAFLRETSAAEIADRPTVKFAEGDKPTSQQPTTEPAPEPRSNSTKSTPVANLERTSDASTMTVTTAANDTDASTNETAKPDSNVRVTAVPTEMRGTQPTATEVFQVAPQPIETAASTTSEASFIREFSSSVTDMPTTGRTRPVLETTLPMSTTVQSGQSSQLEQNSSDSNADGNASDQSKHESARHDVLRTTSATFIPNQAIVTSTQFSEVESPSSVSRQISTAVVDRLGDASAEGPTTVRIRLEQEELGTIDLHLSVRDGVVSIRIVAADQLTQQLINGQMDDLRQSLAQRGVNFGDMQVSSESGEQQSSGEQRAPTGSLRITPQARFWRQPTATATTSRLKIGVLNYVA